MNSEQGVLARKLLGWSLKSVGEKTGLPESSVWRFENGTKTIARTHDKLRSAYEEAGIGFVPLGEPVDSPSVCWARGGRKAGKEGGREDFINDEQARMARTLLRWSMPVVSEKVGLSDPMIHHLEVHSYGTDDLRNKLYRVYTDAGVRFLAPGAATYSPTVCRAKDLVQKTC